jgi:hypothetical protein
MCPRLPPPLTFAQRLVSYWQMSFSPVLPASLQIAFPRWAMFGSMCLTTRIWNPTRARCHVTTVPVTWTISRIYSAIPNLLQVYQTNIFLNCLIWWLDILEILWRKQTLILATWSQFGIVITINWCRRNLGGRGNDIFDLLITLPWSWDTPTLEWSGITNEISVTSGTESATWESEEIRKYREQCSYAWRTTILKR